MRNLSFLLLLSASVVTGGQPVIPQKFSLGKDAPNLNIIKKDHSLIINYTSAEAEISNIYNENGAFYRISMPGHIPTREPGKPEVPVISKLISLPGDIKCSIRITDVRSEKIKPSARKIKGILYPAQESEIKSPQQKKPFLIDKEVYKAKGIIKSDTVRITPLGHLRGFTLANLEISPVRYDPKGNNLEVITSMNIEILFDEPVKYSTQESQLFLEPLTKSVLNFGPEDLITGYTDKPVRMIILTDSTYLKALKPFIRWKTQKGYRVEVLTVGPKSAGTTYTQIKSKLASVYNSSTEENPHPDFLLIAGDIKKVPYYGTGNVTDMYYGEFTGNGDFIPEMYVGRIPAADTIELKNAIKKIIQYEKFEFDDNNRFHENALATAGQDVSHSTYMDGQIRYAADNYFTSANRIKAYNFYHAVSATSKDTIIRLINKGVSFINYSGHGIATGWQHINDGIFTKDTSLLKNRNMYPFIISNACRTAEFSLPECFGNRLVVASNKGAVGFIGCSNDSYWDEDYYWTVGLGPITANPTYVSKGLGAYDRLFHTHSESPSDWYTTMGQIVHAGNLSVSASTSSYKKYYWETYNLVGDPSMIPIMGTPLPFNVSLPDTLPNGITTLSLKIEPFSYIAISHNDTLWDASFANYAGSVILNIPGASDDSCLVVITGQNRKPLFKTVYFSKIKDRYLNVAGTMINDSIGNNNKKADYGETFYIGFDLDNLGMKAAGEVTARLATSSEWVTINSDFLSIGEMAANSDTTLSRAFSITVSNMVPDMGILPFDLIVKDPTGEKTYSFDLHAHAPKLEIISMKILDENNDYLADPGEALNFVFRVRNYGSSNATGNFIVTSSNGKVDILAPNVKSGLLEVNEISDIVVPAKLTEDTQTGTVITLISTLICDSLSVNRSFSFRVGKLRENFESSSFKVFPWINPGPNPWVITESNPFEGAVSARSGVISKNGVSRLMMRAIFPSPDSIRFFYKVSSELNYDFLSFKLNGSEIFRESGESGWKKKTIPVPAGAADMEWIYKKDDSRDIGADAAWIDLVDFSVAGSLGYIQRDLKVVSILSPVQRDQMARDTVTARVANVGRDTINGFYLAYTCNNRAPVRQFFQKTIIPYSDTVTVTFNVPADMSKYGLYEITVYSFGNNEDYLDNDTLKISLENNASDKLLIAFPNPFTNSLRILINDDVVKTNNELLVSLIDLKGTNLLTLKKKLVSGENIITLESEISGLPPGIYFLNIRGQSIKTSIRLLKMKQ